MKNLLNGCLLASGFGILVVPVTAHAQDGGAAITPSSFRLSTGVSFSSGDYGEAEDTDVFAVPVSLTYRQDGLKIRVSVPWVRVDGPGSLLSTPEGRDGGVGQGLGRGGDSDNSGSGSFSGGSGSGRSGSGIEVEDDDDDDDSGSGGGGGDDDEGEGRAIAATAALAEAALTGTDNRRSGVGDVNITAIYSLDLGGDLFFEPGVKVKIPTASRRKRLGSGKVDVTVSGDLVKDLGPASFYLHARRKFAGKPSAATIRSTWGAGGGASLGVARGFSVGVDYDWQQSAFRGNRPSSEATAWAYTRLGGTVGLTIYGSTGFKSNSAEVAGGASVSIRF